MTDKPKTPPPLCALCGRPVGAKAVTYELLETEKHIMRVLLQEDTPVVYCRACDHLSKNPRAFAEFMRGHAMTQMRAAGVPGVIAEARAKKQYDFYLQRALDFLKQKKASKPA
jgi:hypothetical protein